MSIANRTAVAHRARTAWTSLPPVERVLLLNVFLGSLGMGLYSITSVIYLTRFARVSAEQVGLALSGAAILWLLLAGSTGRLIDRHGARELAITFGLLNALCIFALIFVSGFVACCVVLAAMVITGSANSVSRSAVLGHILRQDRRVHVAARNRSAANLGFTIGSALAGFVLVAHTKTPFDLSLIGFSLCLAGASLLYRRFPPIPAVSPGIKKKVRVADRKGFLMLSIVFGLLTIHDTVLSIGMPLWLVHHTSVPVPLAAWLLIVNTAGDVLLQVRVARGADTVIGAKQATQFGGLAVALSCAVLAIVGMPRSALLASLIAVVAVLILTYGELRIAAGSWGLLYGLAPASQRGIYSSIFSMGQMARSVLGPVMVTSLTALWGSPGWLAMAGFFAVVSLLTSAATTWAAREVDEQPQAAASVARQDGAIEGER